MTPGEEHQKCIDRERGLYDLRLENRQFWDYSKAPVKDLRNYIGKTDAQIQAETDERAAEDENWWHTPLKS